MARSRFRSITIETKGTDCSPQRPMGSVDSKSVSVKGALRKGFHCENLPVGRETFCFVLRAREMLERKHEKYVLKNYFNA